MKLLDYDSPLMQALTKIANLMILNLLTIICCIPIITAGASLTALHYMCLKMKRNEDGYIVKGFFKAFAESFKQATPVWLILIVVYVVFFGDFLIVYRAGIEFNYWFQVALAVVGIFVIFVSLMVFPVMAKFSNTTFQTLKNALIISIVKFPITLAMLVLNIIPILITLYMLQLFPFVLMFGFSAPAFLAACLYNKYFLKLEEQILAIQAEKEGIKEPEEAEEDERIFHDQLEDTLENKKN